MNTFSSCPVQNHSVSLRTVIAAVWILALTVGLIPAETRADISSFDIGLIPDQSVRHGYTRSFEVYSSELGESATFSMVVEPEPVGAIALDPATGLFEYTPDSQARRPFDITFTAESDGSSVSQTVAMFPKHDLIPETDIIAYVRDIPDPTSNTTVIEEDITEGDAAYPVALNHNSYPIEIEGTPHYAKRVRISGKTVLFDSTVGVPYTYHDRNDIAEMIVSAETVIVRNPVNLPQTNVTINARELRFEDRDGATEEERARIITTPRTDETVPTAASITYDTYGNPIGIVIAENGQAGPNAATLTLNVNDVFASDMYEPERAVRFVLTGGQGQQPGPGADGAKGISWSPVTELSEWPDSLYYTGNMTHADGSVTPVVSYSIPMANVMYYQMNTTRAVECDGSGDWLYADPDPIIYGSSPLLFGWPQNGVDAVSTGIPGQGGAGGNFTSNLDPSTFDLHDLVDVSGGDCGTLCATSVGGAAGTPNPAYMVVGHHTEIWVPFTWWHCGDITWAAAMSETVAGTSYDCPPGVPGPGGTFEQEAGSSVDWLTPAAARGVLMHVRDTYLNGQIEEARATLAEYLELFDGIEGATPEDQTDFEQLQQEMEVLYHRASNNLDYFGNPAGWVPMLSFEANLTAFQNEIERAIRVLYATYWLDSKADEAIDKTAAMTYAKGQLALELEEFIAAYNAAQTAMPGLEVQAQNIATQTGVLTTQLGMIEERLLEQARRNLEPPWWKKALRIVSAGLSMIPVGQPALGAIGGGLDIISNIDSQSPLDSLMDFGSLAGSFMESGMGEDTSAFNDLADDIDTSDEAGFELKIDSLKEAAGRISGGLGPMVDAIKGTQAPKSELEAELERLKAADPAFQEMSKEIQELTVEKELFAQRIAETVQTIAVMATSIDQAMLGVMALNDNLTSNAERIDERAFAYIKEMERRAKDRLLKYQYYVVKAFEYRMLREYSGELNLNSLFEAFQTLVEPDDHLLSEAEFDLLKVPYIEELSRITAEMFDDLNEHAPERSVPIAFGLSQDELDALNRDGFVYINMKDKNIFGRTEENLRIVDLRTDTLVVSPASGGSYGGTALLRMKYEHSGVSLLSSQGNIYTFNHYRTAAVNPITWKTVYDGISDTLTETSISAASASLLQFLLAEEGRSTENLMLYSRPAAWAEILITKEVTTSTGEDMAVDELRIEVEYDYFEKRTDQSELDVRVAGDIRPTILVESPAADVNGRRDGRGDFVRVFNRGQTVTLEAPSTYGTWVFDEWADASGAPLKTAGLSASETLQLHMDDHTMIQAIYVDTGGHEPPGVPGDVDGNEAVDAVDIQLVINNVLGLDVDWDCDVNRNGTVDAVDIQLVINAALGIDISGSV